VARPSKLTPATERVILDALEAGATRTAAFEAAGIARSKISVYLRRFGTFRDAVIGAEATAELRATVRIRDAVDAGSWRAAFLWLERRRPDDWGRRDRVEIAASIRALVQAAGLGADVEAEAVEYAEAYLKGLRRAGA
jgi:hypothetical protein